MSADIEVPEAEAVIRKASAAFSSCAKGGRGGSTELTWIVPSKGKVEMITDPEPAIDEWCLIKKAAAIRFDKRASGEVFVNARIWLESSGQLRISVTQAAAGRAVVCEVTTRGDVGAGTVEKAVELGSSFETCYSLAQRSDPSQSGDLHFELDLKADGTVSDSKSSGGRHTDLVRDCANATARLARFPEPKPPANVTFDVRFVAP